MRGSLRAGLTVLWIAAAAFAAAAQGPTTERARRDLAFDVPPQIEEYNPRWLGDWSLALEEAERRNVPVVAMLSSDDSVGFNTVNTAVYSHPAFAAFSRRCVLLAALDGRKHGSSVRKVDGADVAWCDLFRCPCDDHVRTAVRVRNEFATREFWNPLHVFLSPQGAELGRVEGHEVRQPQLDEELARVQKTMGAGIAYDEYRELLLKLRAIVDGREKKGSASAHAELGRLLAAETKAEKDPGAKRLLKSAAMKNLVAALQSALILEGDGLLEDADDLVRERRFDDARRLLWRIQKSFKGLPPAADAAKALASLPGEKDPARRN